MRRTRLILAALFAATLTACPPADDGSDTTNDSGDSADSSGALQWYLTCGDPVCMGHSDHPGVADCTSEMAGATCTDAGASCDPANACNSLLLCTDKDPQTQTGGCPISRRATKRDIAPLDEAQRDALYDALRRMPLTTWRYLSDAVERPPRLGFIIEDVSPSPAVDAERGMVDLYGFTTMAAASLQAQAEQIEALRREVQTLREELRDARTPRALEQ
ncbi:MAG: hypothetical protein R3F39_22945 [Myxococcota bacterium]